jgi:general secretion pathway protein A
MYENSFGFRENPFNLTCDPHFLHLTRPSNETLQQLTRGILDRKGLILLLGEVGMGKTTLLHAALHLLKMSSRAKNKIATALVVNPTLTREELLETILDDFEVPCGATSKPQRLSALLEMLIDLRDQGGTAVLIVDEAHLLTIGLLAEIRSLLSLPFHKNLLQVVLSGQPEIEDKLRQIELCDLLQHVTVRCKLAPLTLKDTDDYIRHRLRMAGAKSKSIFSHEAVEAVHLHSHGIPRVINLLCDHALVSADLNRIQHVSPLLIGEAAAKLHFHDINPLAQLLHNSHSSNAATAELTAPQSTLKREEAWNYTAAPQTVIPECSQASKRSASEVDFPNRVSSARSPTSIRIWIQSLDRWWSSKFTWAQEWMVLSEIGVARAALVAMVRRINPLKAQSDGELACRIRPISEWLQAPWSRDRKLVSQIRHLREWLQSPWPTAYEPLGDRRSPARNTVG